METRKLALFLLFIAEDFEKPVGVVDAASNKRRLDHLKAYANHMSSTVDVICSSTAVTAMNEFLDMCQRCIGHKKTEEEAAAAAQEEKRNAKKAKIEGEVTAAAEGDEVGDEEAPKADNDSGPVLAQFFKEWYDKHKGVERLFDIEGKGEGVLHKVWKSIGWDEDLENFAVALSKTDWENIYTIGGAEALLTVQYEAAWEFHIKHARETDGLILCKDTQKALSSFMLMQWSTNVDSADSEDSLKV